MLKIFLRDIPDIGMNLDTTLACDEVSLKDDSFKCLSPLHIKARIEKADDAVLVKVQIDAAYEFNCARCLDALQRERSDRYDLYFEITPETEFIDLAEDIRQELVITLSGVMLCREDCRGLCPDCGVNLNKQTCDCAQKRGEASGLFGRAGKSVNIE